MWFKHVSVYSIESGEVLEEPLSKALAEYIFTPCSAHQSRSMGFVSPWEEESTNLIHANFGSFRLVYRREEKKIPKEVLDSEVKKRIKKAIAKGEIEKPDAEFKEQARSAVQRELLPKILPTQKDHQIYINTQSGIIVIDDSSAKRCEELVSVICSLVSDIKVIPLMPKDDPAKVMQEWLVSEKLPAGLKLGKRCNLAHSVMGTIKYDIESLEDRRLKEYLSSESYTVEELGLIHNSGMAFNLNASFVLKACKATDEAKIRIEQDIADMEDDDDNQKKDVIFGEMVQVHEAVIFGLIEELGGKSDLQVATESSVSDTEEE